MTSPQMRDNDTIPVYTITVLLFQLSSNVMNVTSYAEKFY